MGKKNILIFGASYGSLFATKLLMAGHHVHLVCTPSTADLINEKGTFVRVPVKGRDGLVEIGSQALPGSLGASSPEGVDPGKYDLVVLGMQEAQYGAHGVRELTARVGTAGVPSLAIMNMPPLPYLRRIPGLDATPLGACFTDPDVWESFRPGLVSLASPDPQAFRPPNEPKNVLQVGLPTNFKAARFDADQHTALIRDLETDIEAARFDPGDGPLEVPVKLRVHDSIFVPLAKWPMLIAGNYRCIRDQEMIPIRDAVHGDLDLSKSVYDWVRDLCLRLGADESDLVPFEKYAKAAEGLAKPSSAARTLFGGADQIERVDCLVQKVAGQQGMQSAALDEIVRFVDARLAGNRAAR
jgi:hypothetical protein